MEFSNYIGGGPAPLPPPTPGLQKNISWKKIWPTGWLAGAKALHQVALDGGDWSVAPDPLAKVEFGGSQRELQRLLSYRKGSQI